MAPQAEHHSPTTTDAAAPLLVRASLAYLGAPLVLFLTFWLRTPLNVLALVLLGFALVRAWQAHPVAGRSIQPGFLSRPWLLLGVVLYLAAAVWYSGIGGMAEQNWDWQKHNAVLQALVTNPWPAWVQLDDASRPLVYYFGFYLVPSAVGHLTESWFWTNVAVYVWGLTGVLLSFLWFAYIAGRMGVAILLIFLLMSGAEYAGHLVHEIISLPWDGRITFWIRDFEWWTEKLQYSSILTALAWVPQHAIGGWVSAGVAWCMHRSGTLTRWSGVLVLLAMVWSPFVAVGICVFVVMQAASGKDWGFLSKENLAVIPLGLVLVFFYGSMERHAQLLDSFVGLYFLLPGGGGGSPWGYVLNWLLMNGVEAGLLIGAAWWLLDGRERVAVWWLFGGLLVNSLLVVGANNDWAMRTSVPAMFVLYALLARATLTVRPVRRSWWLALGVFLAGLVVPFQEAMWLLPKNHTRPSITLPLEEVEDFRVTGARDGLQRVYYFGDPERPFFRYLAAPRPRPRVDGVG